MTDSGAPGTSGGPSASTVAALVDAIDARARQAGQETASTVLRDMLGPVWEALRSIQDRLEHVEELLLDGGTGSATQAVAGEVRAAAVDPAVVERLEAAVERLQRDEASARLVRLVEERLAAGLRAMAERADAVGRTVDELSARIAAGEERWPSLEAAVRSVTSAQAPLPAAVASLEDRLAGTTRREAELLTQQVTALAIGVEATRAMLEQHVADVEHSVGRKATELTRRIAADFGIGGGSGGGRRGSGGRRDPREMGPG